MQRRNFFKVAAASLGALALGSHVKAEPPTTAPVDYRWDIVDGETKPLWTAEDLHCKVFVADEVRVGDMLYTNHGVYVRVPDGFSGQAATQLADNIDQRLLTILQAVDE